MDNTIKKNTSEMLSRNAWRNLVNEEVLHAQQTGQEISIVFIDIDNLKEVNDQLGHLPGDETILTLKKTISLIRSVFRTVNGENNRQLDVVAYDPRSKSDKKQPILMEYSRIGGDEFGVLCYTDDTGVMIVAERLRKAFDYSTDKSLKELGVDLSIGTSTLKPGMSVGQLLHEADEKMYLDKRSHLPELNNVQKEALAEARKLLDKNDIRLRDFSKYIALIGSNKPKK
ncbi:MAG TPA: GGDEF domain-containing protein [Candidatus Saccharimonadales bacterium]|jgi:GGDEF domain-containing protein|nr:GGDEF domain-containing protein [Candidatus Saccharimonadales bacterium]